LNAAGKRRGKKEKKKGDAGETFSSSGSEKDRSFWLPTFEGLAAFDVSGERGKKKKKRIHQQSGSAAVPFNIGRGAAAPEEKREDSTPGRGALMKADSRGSDITSRALLAFRRAVVLGGKKKEKKDNASPSSPSCACRGDRYRRWWRACGSVAAVHYVGNRKEKGEEGGLMGVGSALLGAPLRPSFLPAGKGKKRRGAPCGRPSGGALDEPTVS